MSEAVSFHDLKGVSVFITGGGSGIGAALTESFVKQGSNVAFVQRSDASNFCDTLENQYGVRPLFLSCDATNIKALNQAIQEAKKANGEIRVLVNNAANDQRHLTEEVDEAFWDSSLAINLKAYFFACQAVLPQMKSIGYGAIVNFSSISYIMGNTGYPVYITANSGINGMMRSMAREFGPHNICVNTLAPGWVFRDKQLEKWATPEDLEVHLQRQCLKTHLKPSDIVDAALFLASSASRMMTGQMMVVDGGVVGTG